MMKIYITFCISTLSVFSFAQDTIKNHEKSNIQFYNIVDVETTPVPNQYQSSTCWSYSTLSFIEAELYRLEKEPVNLSEMWVVRCAYIEKANRYVRMHGNLNFAPGGAFHDVLYIGEKYGLMPESAYPGTLPNDSLPRHNEMDKMLKAMVDIVVSNPNKKLSPVWEEAVEGVLDAYLGEAPKSFMVGGSTMNPAEYLNSLPIERDNYLEISSFTHHPFYKFFELEVPDNWLHERVQNVPLDQLVSIVENSLTEGYSVAWGADVSEPGFSHSFGIAVLPEDPSTIKNHTAFLEPVSEVAVSQELRQEGYDNYETQDDHAMHIIGMCKDQNNKRFFIVKNSWGTSNYTKGYLFVSEAYFRAKTLSIMIHKEALPKAIQKKFKL